MLQGNVAGSMWHIAIARNALATFGFLEYT
jgi:hypothetical protein